jgi:hypothetical protein
MQRIMKVGRCMRDILWSLVEKRRAMSCSYLMRMMRAMARSSWETADIAWDRVRSMSGLVDLLRCSLTEWGAVPGAFLRRPEADFFLTWEYFAGIVRSAAGGAFSC